MRIADWKLRNKLLGAALLIILMMTGSLGSYNIVSTMRLARREAESFRDYALALRKNSLKDQVDLAWKTIDLLHREAAAGGISMEEAQRKAASTIREMRYDAGTGYFWINDTGRPVPSMVMHPILPDLDGSILDNPKYEVVGEENRNLFTAFVDTVEQNEGGGFVRYVWPKPTSDGVTEDQPKESFVRQFEPWGWIVGTGVYVDDIEAIVQERMTAVQMEVRQTIVILLVISTVVTVLAAMVIFFIVRSITKPINNVVDWSRTLADGDLTTRLDYLHDNEIGEQGKNLNAAAESIRDLLGRVKNLSGSAFSVRQQLASSAEETTAAIGQIDANLLSVNERFSSLDDSISMSSSATSQIDASLRSLEDQIARQVEMVEESSAAIEEMLASIGSIARTSRERGESAQGLRGLLDDCRGRLDGMHDGVVRLADASNEMDGIAEVISAIAGRTNLLSMNAAIEAAHAGEFGKGFAVVADEMQKLAASAGTNAKSIQATLKSDVRNIELLLDQSTHLTGVYASLESEVGIIAAALAEITQATAELSRGSAAILDSVQSLRNISTEVLSGSQEMTSGNAVVTGTISGVSDASREVGQVLSEIRTGTEQIHLSMQALDDQVQGIVDSIGGIHSEMERFRT